MTTCIPQHLSAAVSNVVDRLLVYGAMRGATIELSKAETEAHARRIVEAVLALTESSR